MALFEKLNDSDYVCSVWFERDRKNVSLETPKGRVIFELWDDEVDEAIEDGFLKPPAFFRVNEATAWQPSAVQYAKDMNLI